MIASMLEKLLGFIVDKNGKAIVVSRYRPASPFILGPTLDFYEPSIIKSATQNLPIARLLVLYDHREYFRKEQEDRSL